MLNRSSIWISALVLLVVLPAQAAIYKWEDENGVVQYTQQPPLTGRAKELKPPPPPAEDPAQARERLQNRLRGFEERRDARIQQNETDARTQQEREETNAFCIKARENLAIAESGTRVMERAADGSLSPLTPEQLEAKRELLRAQIQELCQ